MPASPSIASSRPTNHAPPPQPSPRAVAARNISQSGISATLLAPRNDEYVGVTILRHGTAFEPDTLGWFAPFKRACSRVALGHPAWTPLPHAPGAGPWGACTLCACAPSIRPLNLGTLPCGRCDAQVHPARLSRHRRWVQLWIVQRLLWLCRRPPGQSSLLRGATKGKKHPHCMARDPAMSAAACARCQCCTLPTPFFRGPGKNRWHNWPTPTPSPML